MSSGAGTAKVIMRRIDRVPLAIVSAFVLPLVFFAPLQVYLNNVYEFSLRFTPLVGVLLGLAVVLVAGFYLLARRWPQTLLPVVSFLAVATFVESRILLPLAGHRPFDGTAIDWSRFKTLSIVELTTMIALLVAFFLLRRRLQVFYAVALFILIFHGLNCGYLVVSNYRVLARSAPRQNSATGYFSSYHRLSKNRNIIHIVTDGTSGSFVYDILAEDWDHYSQVFDGFTLFRRAAGRFPGTYPSVPFYMTGRSLAPDQDSVASLLFTHEYIGTALEEHSIVNALARNGFATYGFQIGGLYCKGAYTACSGENIFVRRHLDDRVFSNTLSSALLLLDIGFFQSTPVAVRQRIFNDQKWFLTRWVDSSRPPGVLPMFTENLTTDGPKSSYNYIHHMGGHPPIQFDENCNYVGVREWDAQNTRAQLVCVVRQLEALVERLKQLEIYDETVILIHGDHGTGHLSSLIPSVTGSVVNAHVIAGANPLLLIKPLGSRGPLKISDAPASIGDIPATLDEMFNLEGEFPGIPLDRIDKVAQREREYIWYKLGPEVFQKQALPEVRRYRIRGDVLNQYDWVPPYLTHLEKAPSVLPVNHESFSELAQGFSGVSEQHGKQPARWVDGTLARVYLSFPSAEKVQLVINSWVPPSIPGQSVEISINGHRLARIEGDALTSKTRHAFPVPDNIGRKNINVIEFRMSKAVKFPTDRRYLSIIFSYIGLEPVN